MTLILRGNAKGLRKRLEEHPEELNGRYPNGTGKAPAEVYGGSYLHYAAYYGRTGKGFMRYSCS